MGDDQEQAFKIGDRVHYTEDAGHLYPFTVVDVVGDQIIGMSISYGRQYRVIANAKELVLVSRPSPPNLAPPSPAQQITELSFIDALKIGRPIKRRSYLYWITIGERPYGTKLRNPFLRLDTGEETTLAYYDFLVTDWEAMP